MSSNGTSDPRILLASEATSNLSAARRDQQRLAIVHQLEAVTLAVNQHVQAILALRQDAVAADARIAALEALVSEAQAALAGTNLQLADHLEWQQRHGRSIAEADRRIDAVERGAAVRRDRRHRRHGQPER